MQIQLQFSSRNLGYDLVYSGQVTSVSCFVYFGIREIFVLNKLQGFGGKSQRKDHSEYRGVDGRL
jgi:hypothetical protein